MSVIHPSGPADASDAAAQSGPVTHWLRTPALHDAQALRRFQDAFSAFQPGIAVAPLYGQPLAMEGSFTTFDDTAISIGLTSPTRCTHTSGHLQQDDTVLLMGWQSGCATFRAGGKQWDMADGDAMLVQAGQSQEVVAHTQAHLCSVTLSRSLLDSLRIDVDAALLQVLRADPAVSMLMGYAHWLRDHRSLATPALRRAATLHMHDLAALAAGAVGEVAHQARSRGARAARRAAVKQDIATHFSDAALSPAAVAQRHGITPRYLQMLLEDEGLSFSALVLDKRLAMAHRALGDARWRGRAISALAFEAGFGDLSYFNRSFRRRYGMTPSEVRAQSLRP